ncbi:hypothetical protein [Nocardia brevicatena]|uniref:hypothetical protein n=1 Tax=Nocardia brevicatena TaxID=37327 RepID=UPI000687D0FC|nr:hypothetical protein [Nocardia brevicatena]
MATGVGLHIAEDGCTAAIARDDGEPYFVFREPVLHMSDEGDAALGGEAPPGHNHTITGFVGAVGNPAGITVDDGAAYRAEDLLATALFCLINLSAEYLSGPAEFFATHPARWPEQQVRALREALDYLGLRSVALVGENEIPAVTTNDSAAGRGRGYAEGAARAALAAVLETPAGTTPPDPTTAENATLDTVIMPAIPDPTALAQAYSALQPTVDPASTALDTDVSDTAPPATVGTAALGTGTSAATAAAPVSTRSEASRRMGGRAVPIAIAAALLGLLVGAVGVAAVLRGTADPDQATEDDPSLSSTVTPAAPPVPPITSEPPAPVELEPTAIPETTVDPEPSATPEPTDLPPSSTEPSATITPTGRPLDPSTSDSPTTTDVTSTTSEPSETTTSPLDYLPIPLPVPSIDFPGTGSQDETKPRFVP